MLTPLGHITAAQTHYGLEYIQTGVMVPIEYQAAVRT